PARTTSVLDKLRPAYSGCQGRNTIYCTLVTVSASNCASGLFAFFYGCIPLFVVVSTMVSPRFYPQVVPRRRSAAALAIKICCWLDETTEQRDCRTKLT